MKNFKKRYIVLFIIVLVIVYVLFGARIDKKVYYVKTNEKVQIKTIPKFFKNFIKTKRYPKKGCYKECSYCFFKKLNYEVNVLSFDESKWTIVKGENWNLDTSGLTKKAKIKSDVEINELSEKIGKHQITIYDHGVVFKKEVNVIGFEDDILFMKKGDKKDLNMGILGEWKVNGDCISIKDGEVEALKEGDGEVTFTSDERDVKLNVKVMEMKNLYWMNLGETFNLPDKKGIFKAGDLVKIKEDKVKAIKCGKEKYSYQLRNLTFQGEIFITDFPKAILKGKEIKTKEVEFASSNPKIIECKKNTIFAKQEGKCEIVAKHQGEEKKFKCKVFTIQPDKIIGNAGEEFSLPEIKGIKFKSEDSEIAKVKEGKVELISGGYTNILYSLQREKGEIPVYCSSYENGDDTGKVIKVAEDGIVHKMTVWCQHARNYKKYNTFLAGNGCSLCSLTCVLNGYAKGYEDKKPYEVMDTLEREVVGDKKWLSHHHNGRDGRAMPLSLYGVNACLEQAGVSTEYVSFFERESMKHDIIEHLKIKQPVIIEVSKTNQITGKTDYYWSGSVHTVVLVGIDGDKIIVADPANISQGSGRGRIKKTDLDFITQYMWSCSKEPSNFYWSGKAVGGGYIKINSR